MATSDDCRWILLFSLAAVHLLVAFVVMSILNMWPRRGDLATPRLLLVLRFLLFAAVAWSATAAGDGCRVGFGCDLALASYNIAPNQHVSSIASLFGISDYHTLQQYNINYNNLDFIPAGARINVYFRCSCFSRPSSPGSTYLAGIFPYKVIPGDTYGGIAGQYSNLTTADWLQATNTYPSSNSILVTGTVNVTINCSCGEANVSNKYGLFLTYPLSGGETLAAVAANYGFSSPEQMDLIRKYNNPAMDNVTGSRLIYIPVRGNGRFIGAIAGVGGAIVALFLVVFFCIMFIKQRKAKKAALPTSQADSASGISRTIEITIDKSVEFSYEELSNATEEFSSRHKIGQGGFGAVYYAELRGEKAAIKKMDMQDTQQFLAELKVLTHVHHVNLVRLIGFCTENSLFLVYEYVDNGNLNQHLRGTGHEPLSWAARVQIALDSARGLEYIHEHTDPVYIHRDIKSENILITKNYRGKVADFGLAKLIEVGKKSLATSHRAGTFGYMSPEYAQYGHASHQSDVYAFGVVLYQLISAKKAIVSSTGSSSDSVGLVSLFEKALSGGDRKEGLKKLIDPRLGEDYPMDSILEMVQLARACTQENRSLRPTMIPIVIKLTKLSSTSEFLDMNANHENQGLVIGARPVRERVSRVRSWT